jgi:hypothetical protein
MVSNNSEKMARKEFKKVALPCSCAANATLRYITSLVRMLPSVTSGLHEA